MDARASAPAADPAAIVYYCEDGREDVSGYGAILGGN